MWFTRKSNNIESKLQNDLHKFDYDDLELLLHKADDKIIEVTMNDGVKLVIKPAPVKTTSSVFGRFDNN